MSPEYGKINVHAKVWSSSRLRICSGLFFFFFLKVCGDYLLSKMDVQSCISYRNFASCMGDSRLLNKIDGYIQEHLLQISEQEEFLKLPRLKVRRILNLPYSTN